FEGLPFPAEQRDEYAYLVDQNKEIDKRVKELEARKRIAEEIAARGQVERPGEGSDVYRWLDSREARGSVKERDIFDMSTLTLDPTVVPTSNSVVNPARALGRVETISGSNTWNGVTSGAITAARVAEATAGSDNAPTLAAPSAQVTKAHATVPYSYEILEDWG